MDIDVEEERKSDTYEKREIEKREKEGSQRNLKCRKKKMKEKTEIK